jgi:hypothetical protein
LTSNVKETWLAMVAMLLKHIVIISPIDQGSHRHRVHRNCITKWSIQIIRLGHGVKVTNVPSMKFYNLFKEFQLACPFMAFNPSKTSSYYNVIYFKSSSLELFILNFFKSFTNNVSKSLK